MTIATATTTTTRMLVSSSVVVIRLLFATTAVVVAVVQAFQQPQPQRNHHQRQPQQRHVAVRTASALHAATTTTGGSPSSEDNNREKVLLPNDNKVVKENEDNDRDDVSWIQTGLERHYVPIVPEETATTTATSSSSSSSTTTKDDSHNEQNWIRVEFRKQIPKTPAIRSVRDVQDAWMEYVWERGGGVPFLKIQQHEQEQQGDGGDDNRRDSRRIRRKRTILPALLEEELVQEEQPQPQQQPQQSLARLEYRVSKWDANPDYVPDSHAARVEFVEPEGGDSSAIAMTWTAKFRVRARPFLWKAIAQSLIGQTCENFVSYLKPPVTYTRTTVLDTSDLYTDEICMIHQWLKFVWKKGGGLPTPIPPIMIPSTSSSDRIKGNDHAAGTAAKEDVEKINTRKITQLRTRTIVPPFLRERITHIDYSTSTIHYRVENPGYFTMYPVHTHRGQVQFVVVQDKQGKEGEPTETDKDSPETSSTSLPSHVHEMKMIWTVQVRPYNAHCEAYIRAFTSAVISTLARNFKVHTEQPNAMVAVKPPRGGSTSKDQTLMKIRKDTWLGGVMEEHLRDKRSTWEQTLSLVQPWTWGRNQRNFDNVNAGEGETWTTTETTTTTTTTHEEGEDAVQP